MYRFCLVHTITRIAGLLKYMYLYYVLNCLMKLWTSELINTF